MKLIRIFFFSLLVVITFVFIFSEGGTTDKKAVAEETEKPEVIKTTDMGVLDIDGYQHVYRMYDRDTGRPCYLLQTTRYSFSISCI